MEVVSISIAVVAALFGFVSKSIVDTLVVRNRLLVNRRNDLQIVTAAGKKINVLASDLTHEKVREIVSSGQLVVRA